MKYVKYFWVLAGLLLVVYIWQNHTLQTTNSQLTRVQADNEHLKKRLAKQSQNQVSLSDVKANKEQSFNSAKDSVKQTMQLIVGSDPRKFETTLVGKASPSTISSLKADLTPTVTTSQFDSQNVVYIGAVSEYADPLEFLIVAKNDTQQNTYYVTYDLASHEITRVDRAAMKGAFNEYNE
ncbi:hypothetical protein WOSG25_200140 [Weissella oryzae SG25]|uniref:Uncharacterized protein n=1 Tax=Weissella oryzae (strain DSM 25784 / JCM 18191 / LMG 30913 / SG25) TaxID=1329250 RepID=A0A069CX30_WEIOS|nr:hypothetical protein [Weissella oryzae]GAK31932.1 hypothetical protein WOSG25_200140 [Weissella oryzae SG25]